MLAVTTNDANAPDFIQGPGAVRTTEFDPQLPFEVQLLFKKLWYAEISTRNITAQEQSVYQ